MSPIIPMPSLLHYNFFDYLNLTPMMQQSLDTGAPVLGPITTDHEGGDTEDLIRVSFYRFRLMMLWTCQFSQNRHLFCLAVAGQFYLD